MCNKNAPPKLKHKSRLIEKEPTVSLNNPSRKTRKTRTKTRKPKFLSLLRLDSSSEISDMTHHHHQQQLNLFPLHPENHVDQEKDQFHDENMAYLFSSSDTNATTLTSLLEYSENNEQQQLTRTSSEEDSKSPSLTYAYRGQDSEMEGVSCSLVKTALRNKERDASEEKWVSYSEVVEEKQKEEEVTSCAADVRDHKSLKMIRQQRRLSLKLDYQEILNAWSDKGPLYIIEGDQCPQTVPDLHDDHFPPHDCANVLMDGWGWTVSNARLWRVPEKSKKKMEEEMNGGEGDVGWKIGQREASVLRYKEKRQSRLFAKRIRYEVRKLNAEKRPRMKGRFVRRS